MTNQTELQERLAQTFAAEFEERLNTFERDLLALETADDDAWPRLITSLLREAHSLKGAAHVVGRTDIGALGHAVEGHLETMRAARTGGERTLQPLFDALAALAALQDPVLSGAVEVQRTIDGLSTSAHGGGRGGKQPRVTVGGRTAGADAPARATRAGAERTTRPARTAPPDVTLWAPPAEPAGADPAITNAPGVSPASDADTAASPGAGVTDNAASASGGAPAGNVTPGSGTEATGPGSIRIRTEHLDALLARGTELVAARDRATRRQDELRALRRSIEAWRREWQRVRGDVASSVAADLGDPSTHEAVAFAADAGRRLQQLDRDLARLVAVGNADRLRLTALADSLGTELLDLRLVPVATLFERFPRMVRDLARASGKRVHLRPAGWETEIDRQLLEQLMDPVMHLLRNAVDHGIEPEAERVAAGKSPVGEIRLEASQRDGGIRIEVADDGRGIDVERVRRAAIQAGVTESDLPTESNRAANLRLALHAGVSTAGRVSEVSGRGVGLDVVREAVARVGGRIEVASEPGAGTRIGLQLPLTLVLVDVILVGVAGRRYALPIGALERCVRLSTSELTEVSGRPAIRLGSDPVVLSDLGELLGGQPTVRGAHDRRIAAVINPGDDRVGLIVDVVHSAMRVVVKSLGPLLESVGGSPIVAGASIIGDDELVLVLDPGALVRAASAGRPLSPVASGLPAAADERPAISVLVVDDSVTTRTLEKSILEAAGFSVAVATDGLDALAVLRREQVDLVVSDVDMPRLDGLELTRRIKADPRTQDLPVVLVTALDSPAEQERGLDAGADAYLLKSTFDQRVLLETIRRLAG